MRSGRWRGSFSIKSTSTSNFNARWAVCRPAQIVLYGTSQAGYWVPRALAFEHRIAAAIADPGAYDVFQPWRKALPAALLQLFDSGDKQDFDRFFEQGMQSAPTRVQPALRANGQIPSRATHVRLAYETLAARPPKDDHQAVPRSTAPGYTSEFNVSISRNCSMSSAICSGYSPLIAWDASG